MTRDHLEAIRIMSPQLWQMAEHKTSLLGGDRDVDDPIGGPVEQYYHCAQQISEYLKPLLADVTSPRPPADQQ
jgi:protein-tyrosine-phosphatase